LYPEEKQGERRLINSIEAKFRKPWWIMYQCTKGPCLLQKMEGDV
jgi:hypothetical protein